MSQFASLNACQIPLKLGFPSGVRGIVLDGVCAKPAVAVSNATRTNVVNPLICFLSPPACPGPVLRLEHSPRRDSLHDRHIRKFDSRDRVRAEWPLSTPAYSIPDHQS